MRIFSFAFLLSPPFITQGRMGTRKTVLILMKNSHFDRTLRYKQKDSGQTNIKRIVSTFFYIWFLKIKSQMLPSSCAWWLGWRRLLWGIQGEAGRCGEAGGKCWEGRRQASSSRLSAAVQEHDLSSKIGQFSRSQDHEDGGHGSDVFHKGQTFTRTSSFL